MKLYIVKGVSPTVPGQPQFVSFDQAKAGEFAADLVTTLAIDNATPPWLNPVTSENWRDKLVDVQAWLWACEHGSSVTHGRNWVKETVALGRDPGEETGADVWIEEHDVEMPASRKVWFGAFDGENGTVLNMAFSQLAIEDWLLEQVDKTREEFEEWESEQAPGALVGFDDFMREEGDYLDSWSWSTGDVPIPGVDPAPMTGRDVLEIFKPLPPEEIAALRSVGAPGFENDAEAAVDAAIKAAIADGEVGCGQCEGSGTIEGGLGGDGEDEACPVCDGTGDLPAPEVKEGDPAALIGAGLDLIDDVQWTVIEDAKTVRFLSLDPETDEPRVFRARIERENV